ncbi:MAG: hypothetical protein A3C84_03075 [Candidatus Ryanbacteria bacterium RIFCSPHIGHO2_02_FULL_48_12]|uniref:Thioredoxin domain-containing protein n=1 Tax=Candidatus Ryanbacteria bacterium RIFCSPHIGHO2_01_FULL_48_27 TaxID=1802115 RepID=A0A1G2G4U6_9BACT|nr:MAG: hypothetical protein A2756_01545 [Candidatus Ryanbacteria bacterium RIFCSPHIGHO2_01_FULL_48_27]OGZ49083.1 MAG: hypothetical protein A3C84_03075 [Candidatus Ryanbacteria bacterium RIFCSPHIGHO2_02_FULL_48_12]
MNKQEKEGKFERAPEFSKIEGYVNLPLAYVKSASGSDSMTMVELVGKKVILVHFWTYSSIACLRFIHYLALWRDKYKDLGLEVVGIHTPEFIFEKSYEHVLWAVKQYNIKYPVLLDNRYGTWNAFGNRYWPRSYLVDIDGFMTYDHIGTGGYQDIERKIQELLHERAASLGVRVEIPLDLVPLRAGDALDISRDISTEVYFGAWRNNALGSGKAGSGGIQVFEHPDEVRPGVLYLTGEWDIKLEFAESRSVGAKIIFHYRGSSVYLIAESVEPVDIKVLRDEEFLGVERGADIREVHGISVMQVHDPRLYKLVEDAEYGEHTIEIIVDDPGLCVFAFTFA